jgi:hypothetical protein
VQSTAVVVYDKTPTSQKIPKKPLASSPSSPSSFFTPRTARSGKDEKDESDSDSEAVPPSKKKKSAVKAATELLKLASHNNKPVKEKAAKTGFKSNKRKQR